MRYLIVDTPLFQFSSELTPQEETDQQNNPTLSADQLRRVLEPLTRRPLDAAAWAEQKIRIGNVVVHANVGEVH